MFHQSFCLIVISILIIGVSSSTPPVQIDAQTARELRASIYSDRLNIEAFVRALRAFIPDSRTFRTFNFLVNQHCSCGGEDSNGKKSKKTKLSAENIPKRFYKSPYIESKSLSSNPFEGHILLTQQR